MSPQHMHVESLSFAYLIQYRGQTHTFTLLWHVKLSSAPVYGFLEPPRPGGERGQKVMIQVQGGEGGRGREGGEGGGGRERVSQGWK